MMDAEMTDVGLTHGVMIDHTTDGIMMDVPIDIDQLEISSPQCERPTLQTLPHELLLMIIEFVGPKDLISLRPTCHDVSACTLARFSKVHFAERRHILTKHSLDTLIAITAHPVYGKEIRSISLGSSRICHSTYSKIALCLEHENDPRIQSRLQKLANDAHVALFEQAWLENVNKGSKMIAIALDNIHKRGIAATLGTWVDVVTGESAAKDPRYFRNPEYRNEVYFSGWGSLRSYGSDLGASGIERYITFEEMATRTINILLHAIGYTRCAIQSLSLSIYKGDRELLLRPFAEFGTKFCREKLYPKIQSIQIQRSPHVESAKQVLTFPSMDRDTMISLVRLLMLVKPKKLKTCTPLPFLYLWLNQTELIDLHIVNFAGGAHDLFNLLGSVRLTLKSLTLEGGGLRGDNSLGDCLL